MCGIAGWLRPGGAGADEELVGMAELLAHRGPDDRGILRDRESGIALVHNRLSIIDLSAAGHQPMRGEDGTVVLVFNGEIYNFRDLRARLRAAGHVFRSQTDSEVLVHGYEEWGRDVLDRVRGMFALALWDARRKRLLLARDPMGIKPLYTFRHPDGGLVFASELKAFRALAVYRPEASRRAVRQFLETNFIWDPEETSLVGVRKVPPGHFLELGAGDLARGVSATPRRYFTPPAVEPMREERDFSDRVDRLYGVLDEVVQQHLVADVPVALLLSGGLDSSVVAALASRHARLRTITMGFGDSRVDERAEARLVAKHIGSDHEEVLITPQEVVSDLENAVWYVDDLFGDWGVISTRVLYAKCRARGVKVVLVGEGSDELFGGYGDFKLIGSRAADGLSGLQKTLRLYQFFSGRRWGRGLWGFAQTLRELTEEAGGDSFAATRLFETRHQLPSCYNMKVDKASMAASVEARVPFLDVRVAEEGFRAPRAMLLRNGTNKELLRAVAERYRLLPEATYRRRKYGGSIAASWIAEVPSFRSFARDVVLDPSGWTVPLGLKHLMEDYFDRGRTGRPFPHPISIYGILAWRLLMLNLWSRLYLKPPQRPGTARDDARLKGIAAL